MTVRREDTGQDEQRPLAYPECADAALELEHSLIEHLPVTVGSFEGLFPYGQLPLKLLDARLEFRVFGEGLLKEGCARSHGA